VAARLSNPTATYFFTLPPVQGERNASGEQVLASHDLIEIAAVLWEDGDIEGDPAPMRAPVHIARATQISRTARKLPTRTRCDVLSHSLSWRQNLPLSGGL
jgi:hypothetical protein